MAGEDFSFIGDAIAQVAPYGSSTFRDMGNCSAADISQALEKKTLPNYRDGAGGSRNSRARISDVTLNLTMNDYYPDNLALWMSGTVSDSGSDKVIDALTNIGSFFILKLVGLNSAQNENFESEFFKCTIDPSDSIPLITAGEYAAPNMVVNVLSDDSIVSGSKFHKTTLQAYTGP